MSNILKFALGISVLNAIIYYTVPYDMLTLNLSNIEVWRFFTYQFAHFNSMHLIENILGLTITSAIAVELGMDFKRFLMVYFLAVFVAIPVLALFPGSVIAGNSTGIYGLLAASLTKARKIVSDRMTVPLFSFFIFSFSIVNFFICGPCALKFIKTDIFHFAGFLSGLSFKLPVAKRVAKKKRRKAH